MHSFHLWFSMLPPFYLSDFCFNIPVYSLLSNSAWCTSRTVSPFWTLPTSCQSFIPRLSLSQSTPCYPINWQDMGKSWWWQTLWLVFWGGTFLEFLVAQLNLTPLIPAWSCECCSGNLNCFDWGQPIHSGQVPSARILVSGSFAWSNFLSHHTLWLNPSTICLLWMML